VLDGGIVPVTRASDAGRNIKLLSSGARLAQPVMSRRTTDKRQRPHWPPSPLDLLTCHEGCMTDPARDLKSPILVVEDHEDSRELLAQLLTTWGYSVAAAETGRDAFALLDESSADPRR
jgi:PleD family two-component response regulator